LIQILSIKRFDAAVPRLPGKSAGRINLISGTSNTPVAAAGRPRMPGKPLVRGFSCLPRVNAFFRAPGKERPGSPRTSVQPGRKKTGRHAWNSPSGAWPPRLEWCSNWCPRPPGHKTRPGSIRGYSGWGDYAARNGIACTPGTLVKADNGLVYRCQ